jgi:hypothetical protein
MEPLALMKDLSHLVPPLVPPLVPHLVLISICQV